MPDPVVTRMGILDFQVCVPKDWTDEQVLEFARRETTGYVGIPSIRKEGDRLLNGANERVPCSDRPDFVHIVLDF
jgi:hypothetical protein